MYIILELEILTLFRWDNYWSLIILLFYKHELYKETIIEQQICEKTPVL